MEVARGSKGGARREQGGREVGLYWEGGEIMWGLWGDCGEMEVGFWGGGLLFMVWGY